MTQSTWPWRFAFRTHVGMVRANNEDSLGCEGEDGFFAIADGLGGRVGGEIASHLAVQRSTDFIRTQRLSFKENLSGLLYSAFQYANAVVWRKANAKSELRGMATTLVGLLFGPKMVFIGNVGDSRAYLLRENTLTRLTEDHRLVHEMVLSGALTIEEASSHPFRHILTRSVGVEKSIIVDASEREFYPGDRFLLCSDGLYEQVVEEDIEAILKSHPGDPNAVCDDLLDAAIVGGGADNITMIVIDVIENTSPAASDLPQI